MFIAIVSSIDVDNDAVFSSYFQSDIFIAIFVKVRSKLVFIATNLTVTDSFSECMKITW